MLGDSRAETFFIVAMMGLILVVSVAAIYFFFKTYKKEMAEKALRSKAKRQKDDVETVTSEGKS